jgi:hypothetical protein
MGTFPPVHAAIELTASVTPATTVLLTPAIAARAEPSATGPGPWAKTTGDGNLPAGQSRPA